MIKEKNICPHCKRILHNINAYHYCKEVAIDDLFLKKPDEVLLAFDRLLEHVAAWENVEISATKNCIVFVKNKTFLVAKPMTKCLEIKFYSSEIIDDESLYKCHLWNSKYEGIIRVQNEEALTPQYFDYFRASYSIS